MTLEKKTIFGFYKRLLSLYPREFRERFGESMAQTFNDVCNERATRNERISLTFVISTFAETSAGVIKENLAALKGVCLMNYWLHTIGLAAFFSLLFVGAFWLLAIWTNPNMPSEMQSEGQSLLLPVLLNWLGLTLIFTFIVNGLRAGPSMSIKHWLMTWGAAALFGLLLIAPLAFMEYWNNPRIQLGEFGFPLVLFLGLWFSPTIFFLGAMPLVRTVRAGESLLAQPVALVLRVIFLALLAVLWLNLIRDQMPCFLGGVPQCD